MRGKRGGIVMTGVKIVDWRHHARSNDPVPIKQAWLANAGLVYPQHGKRERLRRMDQIAYGQLREENGLVRHG